ncbi:hypothetical protein TWF970_003694 [Orbilia oligospora]|uniref:Uncharacterized protein n=1 Tax=Orbilia oligospora TaxID=2813651 RepID=A0A7C8VZ94_ORBOL|nr:hypothetical protein TWF970_003694 [Orbilia oligospora]
MFQLTTGNFAVEAPIEELQIASRATNADEWKLYLRWELAYLFTRVRSFDDDLLSEILKYSTPHTGSGPPEAAAAAARSYARDCIRQLTALLAESHREFANVIIERTELGRGYKDKAAQARGNRSERPRLDTSELSRSLVFSPEDVKALWYPLHFAISGRYFDEDRVSDRYSDVRTVLSQTSAWIIREFINLILLGPTDRSASELAGCDIIARSAESVSVELSRWPEISSSLQKRLDGWQRTLISGNSYPTKDSPQSAHIWENLVNKASVMGQSQQSFVAPAPLRPRGSQSPTKQTSYEPIAAVPGASAIAQTTHLPDRTSSYNGAPTSNTSKYQNQYDKQVERLQSQTAGLRTSSAPNPNNNTSSSTNAYASNTSRRIEPSSSSQNQNQSTAPNNNNGTLPAGFSTDLDPAGSSHTITAQNTDPTMPTSSSGLPPGSSSSGNFDDYVRNQFDLQDKTIADAVSYFQRERQRMFEVKERLRELEKQQELLTANYKRQMEDLDRKKRDVFDRYQTEKPVPPVNIPQEVAGAMPQQSTVHFDLGEAERHVTTTSVPINNTSSSHQGASAAAAGENAGAATLAGPGGHEYYDDEEWEREPHPHPRSNSGKGGKLQKMHPEFEGGVGPGGMPPAEVGSQGKGKARVSWIQRATHAIKR